MAQRFDRLSEYLQSEIGRGAFPGAQYAVGEENEVLAQDALGQAVVEPELIATTLDTIYDLASLTKPLVTAMLSVILAERALIDLNAAASTYLPELDTEDKRQITLIELLTHTSGLPAWRPFYAEAGGRADIPAVVARLPMESNRGPDGARQVVYSDPNYILLGSLIERVTGERLDHLAQREIFEPLKLRRTMFNPPPGLKRETAATELGQAFERCNAEEDLETRRKLEEGARAGHAAPTEAPYWGLRSEMIWGEVHDGNAHFLGGVAGHAGLFSTAREVFCLANQFLDGSKLVGRDWLDLFTRDFTRGRGSSRSVGWLLARTNDCSAGPRLPASAFGHTGFTGTSLWVDPDRRRVFVLLTNRIHPRVGEIAMKEARQQFHTLAVEALENHSRKTW